MIDIKLIRENPDLVKENIKKKFQDEKLPLVDKVLRLDKKWRKLKYQDDSLRKQRNSISKKINELKKSKKSFEKELKKARQIPKKIEISEIKRKKLEKEIKEIMYKIPNIIHSSVPIGRDESENVEIKKVGKIKKFNYEILNHIELAEKLKGVDFDSAREVAGNGFYYLRGDLARLHSAMLAFARDFMINQGFEYIIPPFMIRRRVVEGVMSFEEMDAMMYKIEGEDLYLIGTSEHSMIGRFINKTLNAKNLPLKLTSYSPCFRKEVGSHGIEEKGFYRVHQFEKQEMIVICEPGNSYEWYDKMLNYTLDIFKALNIPTRVLEICSGDLADLKAKSCDVEAWSPRQKKYFEVGSLTNMEAAQARRLNIKIEGKGERYFAHTLNNTVLASPRALIALMENNQNKDGSINIPKALQLYMGGMKKIEIKK
ncbi:serine--tRNA ligase [Candidatus Pacearchaeota archaeon]|nr:MAG: serine--tRNA ligase [Candidatus Pacearchaeota archaeon]